MGHIELWRPQWAVVCHVALDKKLTLLRTLSVKGEC